jgi:hypothetical protein
MTGQADEANVVPTDARPGVRKAERFRSGFRSRLARKMAVAARDWEAPTMLEYG